MANFLRTERDYINKHTTNVSTIISHLYSKEIISIEEKENLKNPYIYPTTFDTCDALYSLLERKQIEEGILKSIFLDTCNRHMILHLWKDLNIKNCAECFRFWNIPPKNELFTGRVHYLEEIKSQFSLHKTMDQRLELLSKSNCKLVLHGMVGVGKSCLAIQFVYENKGNFKNIFWLNADKEVELKSQWIELGYELDIFSKEELSLMRESEAENNSNFEEMSKYLKNKWFEVETNFNWLIVVDNAWLYEEIEFLFPNIGGCILVISDNSNSWTKFPNFLQISNFEVGDSEEFLDLDKPKVNNLGLEMNHYPLALYHSCFCIKKYEMSISEYIAFFNSTEFVFLQDNSDDSNSIFKNWKTSLEKISLESEISQEWLQICELLMPDKIPKLFILEFLKIKCETPESLKFLKIHENIIKFGFCQWDANQETYSIHKIVQKFIQSTNKNIEQTDQILFNILENTIKVSRDLKKSHIFHHSENFLYRKMESISRDTFEMKKIQILNRNIVKLVNSLVEYLREMDKFEEKFSEYFELVKNFINEKSDAFVLYTTLGLCYYISGHLPKSKIFYERSLEFIGLENILPTTQIFHHLEQQFHKGFIKNFEKSKNSYKIETTCLQFKSLHSISILLNIGLEYFEMGKYNAALELYEKNLEIVLKIYPDKVIVGQISTLIGQLYNQIGKFPEALENISKALQIYRNHFGEESVYLINTYIELGKTYKNLEKSNEAIENYKKSTRLAEKHYTVKEPDLGDIYARVGALYCEIGQLKSNCAKML